MGESTARIPRVGSSSAPAPGVGASYAAAPRVGSNMAAVGTVPPQYIPMPSRTGDVNLALAAAAVAVGVAERESPASLRFAVSTELETEIKMIDVESRMIIAAETAAVPVVNVHTAMSVLVEVSAAPVVTSVAQMLVSASAVAALGPYPMGMNKTAEQSIPSGEWAKNTSMGARSGYGPPVNNELVVQVAGAYVFRANDARNGQHSTNACRIQRLRAGVTSTVATSTSGSQVSSITTTVTTEVDDRYWLESYASTVGSAAKQVNTDTFLYFDAA